MVEAPDFLPCHRNGFLEFRPATLREFLTRRCMRLQVNVQGVERIPDLVRHTGGAGG